MGYESAPIVSQLAQQLIEVVSEVQHLGSQDSHLDNYGNTGPEIPKTWHVFFADARRFAWTSMSRRCEGQGTQTMLRLPLYACRSGGASSDMVRALEGVLEAVPQMWCSI